jgi:chromate reductase
MKTYHIAVLVGSLRANSLDVKLAKNLIAISPATLALKIIEIGDLPFYNEDLEADLPASWKRFRDEIAPFDGVLFVTPEYNRSVPAVIKNAIDVGSRPKGESVWNGKPAAVVSTSPGAMGGFGANHHLRQSLVFLNMPTLQQPEVYIGGAGKLFDENGVLNNESTKGFLKGFLDAFATWNEKLL